MTERGKFTRIEILSQPDLWKQSLSMLSQVDVSDYFNQGQPGQILVTGCGSTYFLSIWAAGLIQEIIGIPARAVPASELWLSPDLWYQNKIQTLLIAVSRSGTTTETIKAVQKYKNFRSETPFAISCDPQSPLAELSPLGVYFPHAQEESIAQTRSFSNIMLGAAYAAHQSVPASAAEKLSSQGTELLENYRASVSEIVYQENIERFFFLGSGRRYGLACEAMLKMKEMSLSYSEAYHFLEFRHGPMSMVNEKSLVVGLLSHDAHEFEVAVLKDMHELGSRVLIFGNQNFTEVPDWVDWYIPLNIKGLLGYGDVLFLPLLQWLALEKALSKDLNPDKPKNLKAVVVINE